MTKLTGTAHGDAANNLVIFYQEQANKLEKSRQYFMAAVALGLAMETVILTYLLLSLDEDAGSDVGIPASVSMAEMIAIANELDILSVPVGTVAVEGTKPTMHIAKEVVDTVRKFRNLIHPARALSEEFNPRKLTKARYRELADMYHSVYGSLIQTL